MAAKVCEQCGRVFDAKRSTARYCSDNCRKKSHKGKSKRLIVPENKPAPLPPASFEEVADALDDARALSNRFAQLSTRAPQPLRSGCGRIGQAITRAIVAEEW